MAWRWTSALVLMFACGGGAEKAFEDDFTGGTMRVDYFHMGTAEAEHFGLDRVRVEGPWPGSRRQLIDPTNLGEYLVEVADLETNRVLYTRGFASIFGEWQATRAARSGEWGCTSEAVRIPEPRRAIQLRVRRRGADRSFVEVWSRTIDPGSRFVDRAAVGERDVWVVTEQGPPAMKADLLILGDGYSGAEKEKFRSDAKRMSSALFEVEPFASRRRDFNVRAIHTPSLRSGITRPRAGVFLETALGARYNTFDSERYILLPDDRGWRDVAASAPYDFVLILANERKYGGGGIFNLYATVAAGSSFSEYVAVHEFGHHFAGLGNEYFSSDVAYEASGEGRPEPWEPNVTALGDSSRLKWGDLVGAETPVPTPWKKAEYSKRSRAFQERRRKLRGSGSSEEELEALFDEEQALFTGMLGGETYAGRVGAFEGAMYSATGLYRPSADCLMFSRDDVGFCAVCRRAIERIIDLYCR